jgi:hypothetical protein
LKYTRPLEQITDLAGIRVITYFVDTVDAVEAVIEEQFEVVEKSNKTKLLEQEERLGYQSVHYLLRLAPNRVNLDEYQRFRGRTAEIQVRSILQHAWAEIEHDIQYKSVAALPISIRRRFMSLAGMLEIADREFQAIEDEHAEIRRLARASIAAGNLDHVEITADAIKAYLDQHLGPDGRMTDFSYRWLATTLHGLGFTTVDQIDRCIKAYNDDRISRAIWGRRLGQVQRFEDVLLAGMGEHFVLRHTYSDMEWFPTRMRRYLQRLRDAGIPIGDFDPIEDAQAAADEGSTPPPTLLETPGPPQAGP